MSTAARKLAEKWAAALAASVGAMTGAAVETALSVARNRGEDHLWWRQEYGLADDAAVWAGAPEESWSGIGASILQAAGIETVEPADARNTWFEVLSQAAAALASEMGRALAAEVACGPSGESGPPDAEAQVFEVRIGPEGSGRTSSVAFSAALVNALSAGDAQSSRLTAPVEPKDSRQAPPSENGANKLDALLDVELPVSVSFGRAQLPLKDVLKLTTGAIIELNRSINEPVDLLVNNSVIARGEVVVIEGNYGIRIQEIVSREHRLRSLR